MFMIHKTLCGLQNCVYSTVCKPFKKLPLHRKKDRKDIHQNINRDSFADIKDVFHEDFSNFQNILNAHIIFTFKIF